MRYFWIRSTQNTFMRLQLSITGIKVYCHKCFRLREAGFQITMVTHLVVYLVLQAHKMKTSLIIKVITINYLLSHQYPVVGK